MNVSECSATQYEGLLDVLQMLAYTYISGTNGGMKTILIGVLGLILVLGIVYAVTRPESAVAPIVGDAPVLGPVISETESQNGVASPTSSPETVMGAKAIPTPEKTIPVTSKTSDALPTPSKAPFVTTVYYDGTKFLPETVTIIQGGTVVFENIGDKPMWVGSNNHPDHKRYPVKSANDCLGSSFDQCKATGKGSTWSFTFTELGEWKYHNHERFFDEGKVIVLTKEKYLKEVEELQ